MTFKQIVSRLNNREARSGMPIGENGHMGFYEKYILPRVVHFVCGFSPMMAQRRKIVPLATGRILEIGIGSGLNLPFYNPDQIDHVWGVDPSAEMWQLSAKNRIQLGFEVTFLQSKAENIPLEDHSADTVLMTYTLCTVPDVPAALAEVRRVLKPGGRVLFCEHGAAPDEAVRRWQDHLNPIWRKVGAGCHLNRHIPKMFEQAGFALNEMTAAYTRGWKPASFNYRGIAMVN